MAKTKSKFNISYTQPIIERMMGSEKGMEKFHDDYCQARYKGHIGGVMREPSKKDLKILKMWSDGFTISEILQHNPGLTHAAVDGIIKRTAKYTLRFKKS